MKKQPSIQKPSNTVYNIIAFAAVLFTLGVVLFFGALIVLK
jgi:hypothetical protein